MNPLNKAWTRNIDIRYKWVIVRVTKDLLNVEHVQGIGMSADGFTKPLQREKCNLIQILTVPDGFLLCINVVLSSFSLHTTLLRTNPPKVLVTAARRLELGPLLSSPATGFRSGR